MIYDDLITLSMALQMPRGVGQTTAMAELALKLNAVMVLHQSNMKLDPQFSAVQTLPLSKIEMLRGRHMPVVIDHFALTCLLQDAAREIDTLHKSVCRLTSEVKKLKKGKINV